MREIAGALERPADSRVEIVRRVDAFVIHIPPPRLPWPVYVGVLAAAVSLIAALTIGIYVFVFHRPFPGYESIVGGQYAPQPVAWNLAGLFGFLLIAPGALALLIAAIAPLARRETVEIPDTAAARAKIGPPAILITSSALGRTRSTAIAVLDILRFDLHRDPLGLMESEIVVETRSALDQGRSARRLVIAASITEPEREWLASVLNALIANIRSDLL